MPYEIWMVCDRCGGRVNCDVVTIRDALNFALEIARRCTAYVVAGGHPVDAIPINCPPCSEGKPGIDGNGNNTVRPAKAKA